MPDAQTVGALVGAALLGGLGAWRSWKQLRKSGVAAVDPETIRNLQLAADGWEERYKLEHEARLSAETALATAKADLLDEQRSGDRARRQVAALDEELRTIRRRRTPRGDA